MIQCNDDQAPLNVPPQGKAECPQCGKLWELNEERTGIKSVTITVTDIIQKVAGKPQKGVTQQRS